MTKKFEKMISEESEIDEAKNFFGGDIYAMSHRLPSIYLSYNEKMDYNLKSFTHYTKLVRDVADQFGRDLSLLYAELYKLYGIDEDNKTQSAPDNQQTRIICDRMSTLAQLTLSLEQSKKLLEILNYFDENQTEGCVIHGNDYCFIAIMLNNLFCYYSTVVNFIANKRYLNKEFIESISERLSFIVSNEVESMRRMFKVVECYKEIETKPTFH